MGDRANVRMKYAANSQSIHLYTHWNGTELPVHVRTALQKRWRWDDEAYLTRIIFCEMVKGVEHEETGYGISPHMPDNEHLIIEVSSDDGAVRFVSEHGDVIRQWSFEEYIKLGDAELQLAYESH